MSDVEPQSVTVRLEDGEIDESSESLAATSPPAIESMHYPISSPKRGNDGNYDEIVAVLSKLGEGDDKDPKADKTDIPTSSSRQVYRNDEESDLIDEDEMLCVRGASPLPFVVDRRSLSRKTPPCDSDDFNREVITPQKRRKTSSKRRRKKRSTPRKAERSISSEEDRKDTKSKDGSQSPTTPPPKLNQLCKFYLQDACAKGRSCEYMHSEFPCKFYYTDSRCDDMEKNGRCKLSHNGPLSHDMMSTLIRHLYTAPIELLGEKFIDLRANIAPGDFSIMIHRMHEKLLLQAEETGTGPVISEPNIIAAMREQLSYILSDQQLDKLTQLRVSKYEDLLSLTLAQLNAIGISAIQIEAIQLTLLSSQDIDMRSLFPQCVPKPAEPYEVALSAGDVDLRESKWDEEDEQPLVIDESDEVQKNNIEDDEDDIVIDVVGGLTPPFVRCENSEETDDKYSNSKEAVIHSANDSLLDIAEKYRSDTPDSEGINVVAVILSADKTPLANRVSPKCDTAEATNVNEMSVQDNKERFTPPPREQLESDTPPPKVEEKEEEEKGYTPPPKEEEDEIYSPPVKEVKQLSPLPLEVLDTFDHANDHQEHVKQDVTEFKENGNEPKQQVNEPIENSIRSRPKIRFNDPTNAMDIEPPEFRAESKLACNRRTRHKRVESDHWKIHNEQKEAPKRYRDSRHESSYSHRNVTSSIKAAMGEVACRENKKQVDRQMQGNNSSEDWDAEEQNETAAIAPKPKQTAATEIVCIDSPDNSDDETGAIFANSTCPDLPRRLPNLDNYKPALEIDAHLTYPAMEYKVYEIFLPKFDVNKPTLMDKLVKANSSDPRLKTFLEKEKNYGFLPKTDYSFFPPACNSQGDPRLRYANTCPEPNYNSSPILYGYLQRSLWYQELKSNLKIQINHSVSDLVRALNGFHKDPTPNKIFDLFQIECAGVLLEVMQNVGIFIDAHGGIIELSNYQQLCAPPQLPQLQPYTNNNNGNNYSGSSLPLKPGLLGYAPPGMYPHPPMMPQNNEKSFMQQAFGNDYPMDCNNNNNNGGVQPPESSFYVRERNFNRNCGGNDYHCGGSGGVGPSNFKQSRSHYRRPQKVNFNRRM